MSTYPEQSALYRYSAVTLVQLRTLSRKKAPYRLHFAAMVPLQWQANLTSTVKRLLDVVLRHLALAVAWQYKVFCKAVYPNGMSVRYISILNIHKVHCI